jgi:hypothetical protein
MAKRKGNLTFVMVKEEALSKDGAVTLNRLTIGNAVAKFNNTLSETPVCKHCTEGDIHLMMFPCYMVCRYKRQRKL